MTTNDVGAATASAAANEPVEINEVPVPKVVSFDIGNTLLRLPPAGGFCAHFSRTTGVAFDTLRPLFTRFFLTRGLPIEDAVTLACAEIGYPNPRHVVDSYTPPAVIAFDDVVPALTRLRAAGITVITVSNCTPWDAGGIDATGLTPLLDEVFYSFQVGAAKPDPRIFRHVQAAIAVEPEEILHVGDTPTADVQAATRAGWSALLLDRDTSKITACQNHRTHVIHSLADIAVDEHRPSPETPVTHADLSDCCVWGAASGTGS